MRLLNTTAFNGNFIIEEFFGEVPKYAILSHTWHDMEVTFQDITNGTIDKKGFKKVKDCCTLARAHDYGYAWIDTCCIDKTSSAELSESLNSMYRWYEEADVCYAYLADVPAKPLAESRWFKRGWTLQELIAPSTVIFLDQNWEELGTKESMRAELSKITGIPEEILSGEIDLEEASVAQRMSWAARRETTRIEDRAYCLMGIFGINMPPIYGEGKGAFVRLQEEIMKVLDDHSIFAWKSDSEEESHGGLLATSPDAFRNSANVVPYNPFTTLEGPLTVSSKGIYLEIRFIGIGHPGIGLAILPCTERGMGKEGQLVTIYLQDSLLTMQHFKRIHCGRIEILRLEDLKPSQYPLRRVCVQQGRPAIRKAMKRGKEKLYTPTFEAHPQTLANPLRACYDLETNWRIENGLKENGQTLLSHAAGKGHVDMLWLLLTRSDAQAGARDPSGRTPLSYAAEGGQVAIAKLLLAQDDVEPDLKDEDKRTPLSYAAASGHLPVVQLLLQSGRVYVDSADDFSRTPLSWAARNGHEAVVRVLVDKGAKLDSEDSYRRTPLSWAAAKNNHDMVVALLLDGGSTLEPRDTGGITPLSWAAREGREAVVSLLLDRGAEIESKDNESRTPLLWAACKGQEGTVKLLLEKGASIECRDFGTQTPLSCAAERGFVGVARILIEKGGDIESQDRLRQTPLILAVGRGHEAVVKLLLRKGANLDSQDHRRRTPLSLAAERGHQGIVKLLLEKGADMKAQDYWDRTPLSWATENGHTAVVNLLQDLDS
ncbi:hypothetical protein BBP40_011457 [Aspergillus hancockii]|nr:hypothetical protein BBP40_011457 [Aspergillus hancockii]